MNVDPLITHFYQHSDETAAKGALAVLLMRDNDTGEMVWPLAHIAPGVTITQGTGQFVTDEFGIQVETREIVSGFFTNVDLPALNTSMGGLIGAGYGPPDNFTLVYGTAPKTPQCIFA